MQEISYNFTSIFPFMPQDSTFFPSYHPLQGDRMLMQRILVSGFLIATFLVQAPAQTSPPDGLRKNTPQVHAFTNARIVQSPAKIVQGTLVIRDGVIQSVGSVPAPPDARVWDMKGMTIYPGFVDSHTDYGLPKTARPQQGASDDQQQPPARPPEPRGPEHWNPRVQSHNNAADSFVPDLKFAEKLRSQGITTVLVVSPNGIFKGTSTLVNLSDGKPSEVIVKSKVAQHITLTPEFTPGISDGYPNSLMGVIALIRQTFLDAEWYQRAQEAYRKNPSLPRPEVNEPLSSLKDALEGTIPVVIEASDEQNALRADRIAREFSLNLIVRGSGREYRRIDAVKGMKRNFVLPVDFPETPSVETPEEALEVSLADLRHWDEAPENPRWMNEAGIPISFTSHSMKDQGAFLGQIRTAVERGLPPDAALAALTLVPARMFGVEKQLGSLESGKMANFVITDGDIFAARTSIKQVWVDGKRFEVKPDPETDPRGKWSVTFPGQAATDTIVLNLKGEPGKLQGSITWKKEVQLKSASLSGLRSSFSFAGDSIGYPGIVRMTATVDPQALSGTGEWGDGSGFVWAATRLAPFQPEPDTAKAKETVRASFPPTYPPGEFGRPAIPPQPLAVLVKGATLWTCGPQGKVENGDLLIERGKISKVGRALTAPAGAMVIDGRGKHVTPGIIDAHSHMAVSGSVNEVGQAITAEVRIGDVIDPDDIDIYRGLAGGVTSAHILHGSANPIGGQAQLIKLRWGALPEEMKFEGAPPTIKFALGENVKQSNWGERFTTRYPQTRMGVEQIMRDEFKAALDYERAWQRWEREKSGIPPRRDLELEAALEILKSKRFVHCHSYRQDEILAMMRVAEDFGFRVRVFQHILEGYKVADIMARHGAGGSSFSDWWAYKLEVYDAIPHNGALMHQEGVLTSFNSDSDELARRLNLEAAKAMKYGGVSEEEALKFVTLNPAKQLKVDHRVGSLEPGKDADVVIWSGHPLSTYSICEQTWIDGRRFFGREEDRSLQDEVQKQRAMLIQKALADQRSVPSERPQRSPRRGGESEHSHSFNGQEGRY
jgi:imidazolonepropionase-like amidohydrolase